MARICCIFFVCIFFGFLRDGDQRWRRPPSGVREMTVQWLLLIITRSVMATLTRLGWTDPAPGRRMVLVREQPHLHSISASKCLKPGRLGAIGLLFRKKRQEFR